MTSLPEEERDIDSSIETLRQLRDEIKLQLQMGKMEVKKAWERVERDFAKIETRAKGRGKHSGEEAKHRNEETRKMTRDLRQRLQDLRQKS